MAEFDIVGTLVTQAPGMAGIIVVVILFLKSIEKRDALIERRDQQFIEQMGQITERLKALEILVVQHDTNSKNAYKDREETLDRIEKKLDRNQRTKLKGDK